ncbi:MULTISPECIES: hypothetical protein [unclassified Microcoleus]|uniref:hypothetical protein n=1 Tax=unclassified Microcoleus TaxID=2642155 RepID=UPI002FD7722E
MPVPKQVIENGARCEIKLTSCTILCGTGILPVLEDDVRFQLEQIQTNKLCILPNAFRRFYRCACLLPLQHFAAT